MPGPPLFTQLASSMAPGPSSSLKEEGQTFAELLDTVRRELALRYLADVELAVYEIAFLLGYTDPSSFHRAFRRWMGDSPQEVRARLRSAVR